MARRQVNVFSIERARAADGNAHAQSDVGADERHAEVMAAIADIGSRLDGHEGDQGAEEAGPTTAVSEEFLSDYKAELEQVSLLKSELLHIEASIERTKKEIAGLHQSGVSNGDTIDVTSELDAIVRGTEHATESILDAAEEIDQNARNLAAALKRPADAEMAQEIHEQATRIFEACNFQDLTGQRISKVVNTMRYVEERVDRMIEIWGGLEAFREVAVAPMPNPAGDNDLLHGPGDVDDDPARASQDDIDALFN